MSALCGVSAIAFLLPLIRHRRALGIEDWDVFLAYEAVARRAIIEHGQAPLWTPYHAGGLPFLANPQTKIFSPAALVTLLTSPPIAVKIEIFVQYLIALAGTYACSRRYGLARGGSLVAAAVYVYSGMLAQSVAVGMQPFLAAGFIPWVFLSFEGACKEWRRAVWAGALLASMILYGGVHVATLTAVALSILVTARVALREESPLGSVRAVVIAFGTAAALAAIKILPGIELLRRLPRVRNDYSGYSVESLAYSLVARNQHIATPALSDAHGLWRGMSWGLDENGMYVGLTAALLSLVGILVAARRRRALVVTTIVLVWLSFGDRAAPLSLWRGLHHLPLFEAMRVAQRFRFVWMLFFAMFVGMGLEAASKFVGGALRSRFAVIATGLVLAAVVVFDLASNREAYRYGFSLPDPPVSPAGDYRQIAKLPLYGPNGWEGPDAIPRPLNAWSSQYPAIRENLGTISAYEPIADDLASAVEPSTSPEYRGEVFLEYGRGTARFSAWSPNQLAIEVDADADDVLLVNQNYFPGWRSSEAPVVETRGLIGVPVGRGHHRIELVYRPTSVVAGAIVTAASLLAIAFAPLCRLRRRPTVPNRPGGA